MQARSYAEAKPVVTVLYGCLDAGANPAASTYVFYGSILWQIYSSGLTVGEVLSLGTLPLIMLGEWRRL